MTSFEGLSKVEKDKIDEQQKLINDLMNVVVDAPSISFDTLEKVINLITKSDYEVIVEERGVSSLCGWLMCSHDISHNKVRPKMTLIRGKGIIDRSESLQFCSNKCYKLNTLTHALIREDPLWIRDRSLPDIDLSFLKEML